MKIMLHRDLEWIKRSAPRLARRSNNWLDYFGRKMQIYLILDVLFDSGWSFVASVLPFD